MARPTLKTPEVVGKLEEAFSIGADVQAACAYANIHRDTFYAWCKDDEVFSDRMTSLREKPVLKAYQTVAQNLGETETAKWYLERKRRLEFATRREEDVTSGGDKITTLEVTLKKLADGIRSKADSPKPLQE